MIDEEKKYLEEMFEMTETAGWETLTEGLNKRIEAIKEALQNPAITVDEIRVAQGRIEVLKEFANFRPYLELYVKLKEEQSQVDAQSE